MPNPGQSTSKTSAMGNQVEMSFPQPGEGKERSPIEVEAILGIFVGTGWELCLGGVCVGMCVCVCVCVCVCACV